MVAEELTYIGIDETSLGTGNRGIIVAAAVTHDPLLTVDNGTPLAKAKDILEKASAYHRENEQLDYGAIPQLPTYEDLSILGLETFYWMRSNGGRFKRQTFEHASIAHIVDAIVEREDLDPRKTALYIDQFHTHPTYSLTLLGRYLESLKLPILGMNIHFVGGGDRSVPIINLADILAFEIGLSLNEQYREYHPDRIKLPIEPAEVPFQMFRIPSPTGPQVRETLETLARQI